MKPIASVTVSILLASLLTAQEHPDLARFSAQPPMLVATAVATPAVTFGGRVVHITGVTSHGPVALVASMRELSGRMFVRMTGVQRILTDSGKSAIDFDLGRPIPIRSIWAVIDLSSGRYVVATPPGFPRQELAFASNSVKNNESDNDDDQFVNDHFVLETLWVRPNEDKTAGAWFSRVAHGGDADEDHNNDGKTAVSTTKFWPLGDSQEPPKKIKKGDVVVMIDPFEMQFSAATVGR